MPIGSEATWQLVNSRRSPLTWSPKPALRFAAEAARCSLTTLVSRPPTATTLDRVHAAMLFQARGATYALGSLIQAEKERGPQFFRLANALSALYPRGSEEKRLLDAMLVAVPNR